MNKVTTAEARHIRAGVCFKKKGFPIFHEGSAYDDDLDKLQMRRKISIYLPRVPKRFLWWKWHGDLEYCIAVLWIQNPIVGTQEKNWVMHVYGRENMDRLKKIAEEVSVECRVDVHVRLEEERAQKVAAYDE